MNIGKINGVNFNARTVDFRLPAKDGRALSEAVREYAESASEKARMKAFEVFDKYMTQIAREESENGYLFEDYLQNLRLKFFEALEKFKNNDTRISIGITGTMRSAAPSDEDTMLDKLADGLFRLGKISRREEAAVGNYNSAFEESIASLIDSDKTMDEREKLLLKMSVDGYSTDEIAYKLDISRQRVQQILKNARLNVALKYNLNNIKNEVCSRLKTALLNRGCEKTDDGRFSNIDEVLKKNYITLRLRPLIKEIACGKSFDEVQRENMQVPLNMYRALVTEINMLEKNH